MQNYNRDNRSSGRDFGSRDGGSRDGFRNKRSFGGSSSDDRQMFSAVCDECGKDCQLPFRPTGEKPVYCSDCFRKQNANDDRDERRFEPKRFEEKRFEPKRFDSNKSFDRSESKPANNTGNKEILDQISSLNYKFEKFLKLYETQVGVNSAQSSEKTKENKPKTEVVAAEIEEPKVKVKAKQNKPKKSVLAKTKAKAE